ncbi:MAG: biopolymer transporter ExbD [Verrucomicrobiota bacterium]
MIARKKKAENTGFQLAPMIDMTFLLLIFFMVTTKITKQKVKLDIGLPIASAAVTPRDLSGREVINLDINGNVFIGDKPSDHKALKEYLKKRFIAVPPLKVYLRADAKSPAKEIKKVMAICAEAGAIEVVFGSYKKQ